MKLNNTMHVKGFPGGLDSKEFACNAGDLGLIPGLGKSPGEGNSNPLQCSCLKNPMDGGAWQATVLGVVKSRLTLTLLDRSWAFKGSTEKAISIRSLNGL